MCWTIVPLLETVILGKWEGTADLYQAPLSRDIEETIFYTYPKKPKFYLDIMLIVEIVGLT